MLKRRHRAAAGTALATRWASLYVTEQARNHEQECQCRKREGLLEPAAMNYGSLEVTTDQHHEINDGRERKQRVNRGDG
jgi:hypothetical protein